MTFYVYFLTLFFFFFLSIFIQILTMLFKCKTLILGGIFMNCFSSSWSFLVSEWVSEWQWTTFFFFFGLGFSPGVLLRTKIRAQSWRHSYNGQNLFICMKYIFSMDVIFVLFRCFFFLHCISAIFVPFRADWYVTIIGYWWCLLVSFRIHVACFVNKIWPFGMSAETIKKHCFVPIVDVWVFFSLLLLPVVITTRK